MSNYVTGIILMLSMSLPTSAFSQENLHLSEVVAGEPTLEIVSSNGQVSAELSRVNPLDDVGQQNYHFANVLCKQLSYAGKSGWKLLDENIRSKVASLGLSLVRGYKANVWTNGPLRPTRCGRAAAIVQVCSTGVNADICAIAGGIGYGGFSSFEDARGAACWDSKSQNEITPTVYSIPAAASKDALDSNVPQDVICYRMNK